MKIKGLYPESFGKFKDGNITFSDGLNLIYGENEAGKSTLFAFLKGMLFGIEKPRGRVAKGQPYEKHKPWDTPGAYQGAMDVEIDGKTYRVERNFLATDKSLRVTELETGREVPMQGELMEYVAPEISEAGFVNTVLAPQSGAATEAALQSELSNYVANMSMAKNREVDVAGALEALRRKEKELDGKQLLQEEQALKALLKEDLLEQEELADVSERLRQAQEELQQVEARIQELADENSTEIEAEFQARVKEYEEYCEDTVAQNRRYQSMEKLRKRQQELQSALADESREDIAELRQKRITLKEQQEEMRRQWDDRKTQSAWESRHAQETATGNKGLLIVGILLAVAAVAGFVLFWPAGIVAALAAVVCGVLYAVSRRKAQQGAMELQMEAERIAANPPEVLLELGEALDAMPDEEELSERSSLLAANEAALREIAEQLREMEAGYAVEEEALAGRRQELLAYFRVFAPMEELNGSVITELKGQLMAKSVEMKSQRSLANARRDALLDAIGRANQRLELGGEVEQRIVDTEARLEALAEEQKQNEIELAALALARTTIEKLSQEIHDGFGKELNATMSRLAEQVTDGAYHKVTADEKLQVKAGQKNRLVNAEKLSVGTTEQLQLALRMAVGELMYKERELPLIFDDSFAFYDDNRLRKTLELLGQQKRQILIFTCQEREERLLRELGVTYHKAIL